MVFAVWTQDILHSVSYVYVHVIMFGLLMECRLNGFSPFYSTEKYASTALTKILC